MAAAAAAAASGASRATGRLPRAPRVIGDVAFHDTVAAEGASVGSVDGDDGEAAAVLAVDRGGDAGVVGEDRARRVELASVEHGAAVGLGDHGVQAAERVAALLGGGVADRRAGELTKDEVLTTAFTARPAEAPAAAPTEERIDA